MLPYRDSRIIKITLVSFFILAIFYGYFEARGLLFGPRIEVPQEPAVVHERFITLRGKAERISKLTLNGRAINVTEEGIFEEPYILSDGYNRITLLASDRYGRTRESVMEMIYEPSTVPITVGTSSVSVSTSGAAQ